MLERIANDPVLMVTLSLIVIIVVGGIWAMIRERGSNW